MALQLEKGGRIDLAVEAPGITQFFFGAGWKKKAGNGQFDLDLSAVLIGQDDKALGEEAFVYYRKPTSDCGSLKLLKGDNREGDEDGKKDVETASLDVTTLPANVYKVVFIVSIHEAKERRQNFGQISRAFIRIASLAKPDDDISRIDLAEDASTKGAVVFCEVYRNPSNTSEFKFKAVSDGFDSLISALNSFGLS